eukprot:g49603.t1
MPPTRCWPPPADRKWLCDKCGVWLRGGVKYGLRWNPFVLSLARLLTIAVYTAVLTWLTLRGTVTLPNINQNVPATILTAVSFFTSSVYANAQSRRTENIREFKALLQNVVATALAFDRERMHVAVGQRDVVTALVVHALCHLRCIPRLHLAIARGRSARGCSQHTARHLKAGLPGEIQAPQFSHAHRLHHGGRYPPARVAPAVQEFYGLKPNSARGAGSERVHLLRRPAEAASVGAVHRDEFSWLLSYVSVLYGCISLAEPHVRAGLNWRVKACVERLEQQVITVSVHSTREISRAIQLFAYTAVWIWTLYLPIALIPSCSGYYVPAVCLSSVFIWAIADAAGQINIIYQQEDGDEGSLTTTAPGAARPGECCRYWIYICRAKNVIKAIPVDSFLLFAVYMLVSRSSPRPSPRAYPRLSSRPSVSVHFATHHRTDLGTDGGIRQIAHLRNI